MNQPPGFQPPPFGYGPPPGAQMPPPPPNPMNPYFGQPPRTHGFAIASLVCGILAIIPGCCCGAAGLPLAAVSLTLGIIAINQINASQGQIAGKGMAIAGTVCGGVAIATDIVGMAFHVGTEMLKALHV